MTQGAGGTRQLTTVKCEKHGLRYNPNVHSGCVRCRKETGELVGTAPLPRPTAPGGPRRQTRGFRPAP